MKYFKIATWNVNSIKVRLNRLMNFLDREKPEICCLQELKCESSAFPYNELKTLDYHSTVLGQKTYNGVAILSTDIPTEIIKPQLDNDARIIGIKIRGVTIYSAYAPNGQMVDSEKYKAKLEWFNRIRDFLVQRQEEKVLICGDLNVAPEDRDVYDPKLFRDALLFTELEKEAFKKLINLNFVDTFRLHHEGYGYYTWWDYRGMSFQKNNGLRLDFILATKSIADKCIWARIDFSERKGEKVSDHAPVIAEFEGF